MLSINKFYFNLQMSTGYEVDDRMIDDKNLLNPLLVINELYSNSYHLKIDDSSLFISHQVEILSYDVRKLYLIVIHIVLGVFVSLKLLESRNHEQKSYSNVR